MSVFKCIHFCFSDRNTGSHFVFVCEQFLVASRLSLLALYCKDVCQHGEANPHHDVSSVGDGSVDGPQSHLIGHEVNIGAASPAVGERVVVSGSTQAALEQHAARAEIVLDLQWQTNTHTRTAAASRQLDG